MCIKNGHNLYRNSKCTLLLTRKNHVHLFRKKNQEKKSVKSRKKISKKSVKNQQQYQTRKNQKNHVRTFNLQVTFCETWTLKLHETKRTRSKFMSNYITDYILLRSGSTKQDDPSVITLLSVITPSFLRAIAILFF